MLQGVLDADWSKIRQVVIEVHDHDDRLEKVCSLLTDQGLTKQTVDQESGLEKTALYKCMPSDPSFENANFSLKSS